VLFFQSNGEKKNLCILDLIISIVDHQFLADGVYSQQQKHWDNSTSHVEI